MAVYTSLAPNIHHPLHAKMNNDPYAGRSYPQREEGATIFSRIKSIWSQTAEFNDFDSKYNKTTLQVPKSRSSSDKNSNLSFLDMSGAIPRNSRRFSDVKRIFTFTNLNFARSSASKSINIRIHTHFESEQFLDSETSSGNHTVSPRYYFTALDTPPLTPDSINQDQTVLDSPDSTISIANHRTQDDAYPSLQLGKHTQDEDHAQDTRDLSLSQQVKNSEGKKPQRPIVSLQLLHIASWSSSTRSAMTRSLLMESLHLCRRNRQAKNGMVLSTRYNKVGTICKGYSLVLNPRRVNTRRWCHSRHDHLHSPMGTRTLSRATNPGRCSTKP